MDAADLPEVYAESIRPMLVGSLAVPRLQLPPAHKGISQAGEFLRDRSRTVRGVRLSIPFAGAEA